MSATCTYVGIRYEKGTRGKSAACVASDFLLDACDGVAEHGVLSATANESADAGGT